MQSLGSALLALIISTTTYAGESVVVPLDMDRGHWETKTTLGQAGDIQQLIANIPDLNLSGDQKAEIFGALQGGSASVYEECITDESVKNSEGRIRRSLGSVSQQCELNVVTSTSKEFKGTFNCQEGDTTQVHINVLDARRQKISILYNTLELGESSATATAQWRGGTCPEYLRDVEVELD